MTGKTTPAIPVRAATPLRDWDVELSEATIEDLERNNIESVQDLACLADINLDICRDARRWRDMAIEFVSGHAQTRRVNRRAAEVVSVYQKMRNNPSAINPRSFQ